MVIDRAYNSKRNPKLPRQSDIKLAKKEGKITDVEARDLGAKSVSRGPYDNAPQKAFINEEDSIRRTHKNAGL